MRNHHMSLDYNFIILLYATILCCGLVSVQTSTPKNFTDSYGYTNGRLFDERDFEIIKPANIQDNALQMPGDSNSPETHTINRFNSSARILLKKPLKLWDDDPLHVPSFNTYFRVNINNDDNVTATASHGLAFVIAPNLHLPTNSTGGYLGLTNPETDSDAANQLVAVELDTSEQGFDPDGGGSIHIGINVNSIESINTTIVQSTGRRLLNVWVDYDGVDKVMLVYFADQIEDRYISAPPKPVSPILSAYNLSLRDIVNQNSYFGFSASVSAWNGSGINNCVVSWNLTVLDYSSDPLKNNWAVIIAVVAVAVVVVVVAVAVGWFGYGLRKRRAAAETWKRRLVGTLDRLPREFKFGDIKKATNDFDERNKLGEGGFGVVYKGVLSGNEEIAVKWFSREKVEQGQQDFLAELTIIYRLHHKHLVRLLGWCHEKGKLLLVYEYLPNGSLDHHLFLDKMQPLQWDLRRQIISGTASAIHYLHNEYHQKVVHRDIKASNIMLDSDFNARLGDFGLAIALDDGKTSYLEADGAVMGTKGYIAPECVLTGRGATTQSDVYAFGAVLLEVVCGRWPGQVATGFHFLMNWVWLLHRDGRLLEAVDRRLGDDYVAEEADRFLQLGLACSHPNAEDRPTTHDIVQMISGAMRVPQVPPFRPHFVWPTDGRPVDMDSGDTLGSITISGSGPHSAGPDLFEWK